eukprot:TRINITY_DN11255_c0_g1_i1.p1 TRINITY_DN11255_c0_g1~~TRINITY_DN11255_c0_g1_i1.p1  ORF type:complete len:352 (+),score=73.85 TRINITY_DN11255_c0_g1_i1:248-1303(+)
MKATWITLWIGSLILIALGDEMMFIPAVHPSISIVGRNQIDVIGKKSIFFDWSGIQIYFNITNTKSVSIDLQSGGTYAVSVDGSPNSILTPGNASKVSLANTLDVSKSYQFMIFKQHEPSSSGTAVFDGIWIEKGGSINPPRLPSERRLEWIGGSVTCGYGIKGPYVCNGDSAAKQYETSYPSYGGLVSRSLTADYSFICMSGLGVTTTDSKLSDYYGKVMANGKNVGPYMFQQWVPQGIILDIGNSDFIAKPPATIEQFKAGYTKFIVFLQKTYPNANIFNVCGPLISGPPCDSLKDMVASFNSSSIYYVDMQKIFTVKEKGCSGHPNEAGASKMSDIILPIIKKALNWN